MEDFLSLFELWRPLSLQFVMEGLNCGGRNEDLHMCNWNAYFYLCVENACMSDRHELTEILYDDEEAGD